MQEHSKAPAQTTAPQQQCAVPDQTQQVAGNSAAQAGITTEAPTSGFLDALMELDTSGADAYDWAAPLSTPAGQDERARDQLDLGSKVSVSTDDGGVQVSTTGIQFAHDNVSSDEDALLGGARTSHGARGSLDKDRAQAGYGGSYSNLGGDLAVQGGVLVGTDGSVAANASVKMADMKAGGAAMVDVDAEGRLEKAAVSVTGAKGGFEVTAGAQIEPGSVDVKGTTVCLSRSLGVQSHTKIMGADFGADLTKGKRETRTFTTSAEAEAFASKARKDAVKSNRELTSQDVTEMPEGTSFTYLAQTSSGVSLIASRKQSSVDEVEVVCGKGSKVQLTLRSQADSGYTAGADNGLMATQLELGGAHDHEEAVYELDLSDPEHKAQFEALQTSGARPSVEPVTSERMEGSNQGLSASLPGMQIQQQNSEVHGDRKDQTGHHRVSQGTASTGIMDLGWSALPYAAQGIMGGLGGLGQKGNRYERAASGFGQLGDRWYEQGLEQGSEAGLDRSSVEILTPFQGSEAERLAGQHMLTTEVIDFDDRRRTAQGLHDSVDPLNDTAEIDEAVLPASGVHDERWILESEINAAGVANIREDLAGGLVGHEFGAAKHLEWLRNEYYGGEMKPEDHARAMAAYARFGGQDATESMRHTAGEENVENYLQLDGDNTWIGRKASQDLDGDVEQMTLDGNQPGRQDLAEAEQARLERLMNPDLYTDVPYILIQEEIVRTTRRLGKLNAMGAK